MVAPRLENYDNVFYSDQLTFTFSDPTNSGSVIDVVFNGTTVASNLALTGTGTPVSLPVLNTGPNELQIVSRNTGTTSTDVVIDVPTATNLHGNTSYTRSLTPGGTFGITIGLPRVRIGGTQSPSVPAPGEIAPFAAQNILDTLNAPVKLTLDRPGNTARRRQTTAAYTQEFGLIPAGFDRDEVPPAVGVNPNLTPAERNVRAIPETDNVRAGNVLRDFIDSYGGVGIKIPDGGKIDFYADTPNYRRGVTQIVPIYGTDQVNDNLTGTPGRDNLIYGFDGADTLRDCL